MEKNNVNLLSVIFLSLPDTRCNSANQDSIPDYFKFEYHE